MFLHFWHKQLIISGDCSKKFKKSIAWNIFSRTSISVDTMLENPGARKITDPIIENKDDYRNKP